MNIMINEIKFFKLVSSRTFLVKFSILYSNGSVYNVDVAEDGKRQPLIMLVKKMSSGGIASWCSWSFINLLLIIAFYF